MWALCTSAAVADGWSLYLTLPKQNKAQTHFSKHTNMQISNITQREIAAVQIWGSSQKRASVTATRPWEPTSKMDPRAFPKHRWPRCDQEHDGSPQNQHSDDGSQCVLPHALFRTGINVRSWEIWSQVDSVKSVCSHLVLTCDHLRSAFTSCSINKPESSQEGLKKWIIEFVQLWGKIWSI